MFTPKMKAEAITFFDLNEFDRLLGSTLQYIISMPRTERKVNVVSV